MPHEVAAMITADVDACLSPEGFVRSRRKWVRTDGDIAVAIELVPSRWGVQYYLDVSIKFTGAPRKEGIFSRVDEWIPSGDDIEALLDEGYRDKRETFRVICRKEIAPLLGAIDIEYLRSASADDLFAGSMVSTSALRLTGRY